MLLAQALNAQNSPKSADEAVTLLRTALAREPESADGYAQLAMAYGRKGDLAQADLASATAAMMRGDGATARADRGARQDPFPGRFARLGEGRRHRKHRKAAGIGRRTPLTPKGSFAWLSLSPRLMSSGRRRPDLVARRAARTAQNFSGAQKSEIEKIIRDYLVANPEVLQEVIAALEKKQAADEAQKHQAAVKDNAEAIFNSPRQVTVGNPQGDVTFVEFFDYNCGYCKRAMVDMMELMKHDPKLKVVLKEFPVLGAASVEVARVAVAVRMQDKTGKKYLDFHQKLLIGRGQVDKARAVAAAKEVGLDVARIERDINSDEVDADARREHEARREARAQRHAELRDRPACRGRCGRRRAVEGKGQLGALRQGDLLIALHSPKRAPGLQRPARAFALQALPVR